MDEKDKLYFGDNLNILRAYVADASVDLIDLDPPFNSSATYDCSVAPPFKAASAGLTPDATKSGEEAAATGFYESKEFPGRYPRLQILTIAELLAGKKLEYPTHRVKTFAKAERKTKSQQEGLF